jgi:hypothetical protein
MTFGETPQYKRLLNPQTLDYRFDNQAFVGFVPSVFQHQYKTELQILNLKTSNSILNVRFHTSL